MTHGVSAGPCLDHCVFNDPEVRRRCLDRSIEKHRGDATVEYLPIDNVGGSFATAGAALNHGASLARQDHLVFVHQDVYLHSLRALEEATGVLADDEGIGLLGAIGVASTGELVGRIRDRVILLGEPAREPTDVNSLDELLFIVPRRLFQRERLSEVSDLAWRAYAAEYGLRVRSLGLRPCAVDILLTHNTLTVNLDRLDVAYRAVAASYPDLLPLRTPGGTIGPRPRKRPGTGILGSHRWRYRWLRESVAAHAGRRVAGGGPCVLGDIRLDVDEVIASQPNSPLLIVNLRRDPAFADEIPAPLELMRVGQPVRLTSRRMPDLADAVVAAPPRRSILLTNLGIADLRALAPRLPRQARLLGLRREVGFWGSSEPRLRRFRSSGGRPNQSPGGCHAPASGLVQTARLPRPSGGARESRKTPGRPPRSPPHSGGQSSPRRRTLMDESPTRRAGCGCSLVIGRGLPTAEAWWAQF